MEGMGDVNGHAVLPVPRTLLHRTTQQVLAYDGTVLPHELAQKSSLLVVWKNAIASSLSLIL